MALWVLDTLTLKKDDDGYQHVLVIVDAFTRFTWLYPLRTLESKEVVDRLVELAGMHMLPSAIRSDRGGQFDSAVVADFCDRYGIKREFSIPYRHQSNGEVERAIKGCNTHLRRILLEANLPTAHWRRCLPIAMRIINSSWRPLLRTSSAQLLYGYHVDLNNLILPKVNAARDQLRNVDANKYYANLLRWQEEMLFVSRKFTDVEYRRFMRAQDKLPAVPELEPGALVYEVLPPDHPRRKKDKLLPPVRGPFRVVEGPEMGGHTVRVHDCFHLEMDANAAVRTLRVGDVRLAEVSRSFADDLAAAIEKEYIVERIVSHDTHGSRRKSDWSFTVQWKGYPDPTEEPYAGVANTTALETYAREQGLRW